MEYCLSGWPQQSPSDSSIGPYWKVRNSLLIHKHLLMYNLCIVVPPSLHHKTILKIHEGHQGIVRCRIRSKTTDWWPGISKEIAEAVENCSTSSWDQEPLMTTLPDYSWQMISSDLFQIRNSHYVLTVDYSSCYPELTKLSSTSSAAVIGALKTISMRFGIPDTVRSDNGPQFDSAECAAFTKSYGFSHKTSSPIFPQSNGSVEWMVKTVKHLLQQSNDLALLNFRSTPLPWCNLSPAELLMGRRLRTELPQIPRHLTPTWPYMPQFRKEDEKFKRKQKKNYDKHRKTRALPDLPKRQRYG